jgi:hypothetical protein
MTSLTHVDTESAPWEDWYPEYPGTACKVLYEDPTTGESLKLAFVPPGFAPARHTRHHHGTTREMVYVLFGDLPYVEYADPDAAPRPFTFAQGMLLDRPPRSLHGMSTDPVSTLGALVLEWTSGPNDFNRVPLPDEDPADPTFDPAAAQVDFQDPWVVDADALPWAPHDVVPEWRVRTLSTGGPDPLPGYHPVTVVHLPGSWRPDGRRELVLGGHGDAPAWAYALSGSGRVAVTDPDGTRAEVALRRGGWLRWTPGSTLEVADDWTDDVGLTLLCAGSPLAVAG